MGLQAANLRTCHIANDSNYPITDAPSLKSIYTFFRHRIKEFQQRGSPQLPLTSTQKPEITFYDEKIITLTGVQFLNAAKYIVLGSEDREAKEKTQFLPSRI